MKVLTIGSLEAASSPYFVQMRCLSRSLGVVMVNFPKELWIQPLDPNGKMVFYLGNVQTYITNGQVYAFNFSEIKRIDLTLLRRTESEYPMLLLNNIALPIMQDIPPEERFDTVVNILTMFSQVNRTEWPKVWLYSLQCLANLFDGTPIIASNVIPFLNTNAQLWLRFSDGMIILKEDQTDYTDGLQVGSIFIGLLQGAETKNFVFKKDETDRRLWLKTISIMQDYLKYRFNFNFKPQKRRP